MDDVGRSNVAQLAVSIADALGGVSAARFLAKHTNVVQLGVCSINLNGPDGRDL